MDGADIRRTRSGGADSGRTRSSGADIRDVDISGTRKGITVIGYGGEPLSAVARAAVDEATLIVGGVRHLGALGVDPVGPDDTRSVIILGPIAPALEALADHDGPAVVLASGDPGFFGILRALNDAELEPVHVIPAVSSVATAFARTGLSWDDALIVSTHGSGDGRELRRAANVCRAHPKVALLTGPGAGARELARELLAAGAGAGAGVGARAGAGVERTLVVAQRLGETGPIINRPDSLDEQTEKADIGGGSGGSGGSDGDIGGNGSGDSCEGDGGGGAGGAERVEWLTLAEAAERSDYSEPNVVLCLAPSPRRTAKRWIAGWTGPGAPWALDESAFEHRDGQVTKAEVRAQILPRLAPALGDLVWDLGAGSGSVGIECTRFGAAVIAVEQDPDSCARIRSNAAAHGVEVAVVQGRAPDVLAGLPRPDAVFVGGGGLEVVRAALSYRPARIVVALASIERVGEVIRLLEADGRVVGGVLAQSSRLAALPDGTHRFAALNPVHVLWGNAA
jgi:precorrin-6Y C5,15-methyltransferase (decarboxylating)